MPILWFKLSWNWLWTSDPHHCKKINSCRGNLVNHQKVTNADFGEWEYNATTKIFLKVEVSLELGNDRGWKYFKEYDFKNLDCLKQTVRKNMDAKGTAGEGSSGRKELGREKSVSS